MRVVLSPVLNLVSNNKVKIPLRTHHAGEVVVNPKKYQRVVNGLPYRGPGFLATIWFGSLPHPLPPLSVSSTGITFEDRERETEKERQLADGRGGRGRSSVADPDQNFFHAGSEFFPCWIPVSGSKRSRIQIRIEEFKYFNPKIGSKLLEIWSGLFIPDRIPNPNLDFCPPGSRIQLGSKRHRISDPDPKHWGGVKSYDGEKAWSSITHLILCDPIFCTSAK